MSRRRSLLSRLELQHLEAREVPTVNLLSTVSVTPSVPGETQSSSELPSTTLNGFTYFIGTNESGSELWRSDGTTTGTKMVKDLTPGAGSTEIRKIVATGNRIVLVADPEGGVLGPELFVSDGTDAGTTRLLDTSLPSPSDSSLLISEVAGLAVIGEDVVYGGLAPDGHGGLRRAAFRTPIHNPGATVMLESAASGFIDEAAEFVSLSNGVVFTANSKTGRGLHSANGELSAQFLVETDVFRPFQKLIRVNGNLAATLRPTDSSFTDYELIITDGQPTGTHTITLPAGTKLLGSLVSAGGKAYFAARATDGLDELWVTEGTQASTSLLARVNPETNDAPLRLLRTDGSNLYFPASDGVNGIEMWTSDGTVAGTKMITNLAPGSDSSVDIYFQTADAVIPQADGIAYFLGNANGTSSPDFRLYRTDGTSAGTYPIEAGNTIANFAVTNQFYLGQGNGSVFFSSGGSPSRLATADPFSLTAVATKTEFGALLSLDSTSGKVVATVSITVRDAANQPVAGTVAVEFAGAIFAPVQLVNGNATMTSTLTNSTFLAFVNGNQVNRVNFSPADPINFRPSSTNTLSLILFDDSILTVSDPMVSMPAKSGQPAQVTSQISANVSFGSVPISIEYSAALSSDLNTVTPLGSRDFATGEVSFSTNPLPAPGNYYLRTNVVGPTGIVLRSTSSFVSVVGAPQVVATETTFTIALSPSNNSDPNLPVIATFTASVKSSDRPATGLLQFQYNGRALADIELSSGKATTQVLLSQSELEDILVYGPTTYRAEYRPSSSDAFLPSSAIGTLNALDSSIMQIQVPFAEPSRVQAGQETTLRTKVMSELAANVLSQLKVEFSLHNSITAVPTSWKLEPVSISAQGDAVLTGSTHFLQPTWYVIFATVRNTRGDLIALSGNSLEPLVLLAPNAPVNTRTTLTVDVNDINPILGVSVVVTANVDAVSGTERPSGTVQIQFGGQSLSVPITNGTGNSSQTLPITTLLALANSSSVPLQGTFVPNQEKFVSSIVEGGTVNLPSSVLTLAKPVMNPNSLVPGQSASIRSTVQFAPGIPAIPALTVTYVATGSQGSVTLGTVPVTNGVAQTSSDYTFPLTIAAGDYNVVGILKAGEKIILGTSPSTTIKVIADPGTRYPNIPLAPKYTAATSRNILSVHDADQTIISTITLSGAFAKNAEVAASSNADGQPEVAVGTGPGVASRVQLLNGRTGEVIGEYAPFEPTFLGGIYVAKGDLDGDGVAETIISPNEGGGPRVVVLDGRTNEVRYDFFGIDDPAFRGGARCATADVNGDGVADLIVAAGFQGGPRVAVYDGLSISAGNPVKLFGDFLAFEPQLRNGIFVAAGDVDGDGFADIVAGGGPGGAPRVFVISGRDLVQSGGTTLTPVANFFAGDINSRAGVRLAVKNQDGDNLADIVTAAVGSPQGLIYYGAQLMENPSKPNATTLPGDFTDGLNIG